MTSASIRDWVGRMSSALENGDSVDAIESLTEAVIRFPGDFDEIPTDVRVRIMRLGLREADDLDLFLQLMKALVEIEWPQGDPAGPSTFYHDYIIALVERGRIDDAIEALPRVGYAPVLIELRVDKRLEALLEARPDLFDVERVMQQEIDYWRFAAESGADYPDSLFRLAEALNRARRPGEAIRVVSDALQEYSERPSDPKWSNIDKRLAWILNALAESYWDLGRFDDAITALDRARQIEENGRPNVSQSLNLADYLVWLGRTDEAIATAKAVERVSDFGQLVKDFIRFRAALIDNDDDEVSQALNAIRRSPVESFDMLHDSLIVDGEIDEALELLKSWLADEDRRTDIFLSLQNYGIDERSRPAELQKFEALRRAYFELPEVKSVIAPYVRIEKFNVSAADLFAP
jgi:tetratricopeptide (TPR) repeat protein